MKRYLLACALTLSVAGPLPAQEVAIGRGSVVETVLGLKAGQYVWAPELAPAGPLLLVVNTTTQRTILYRNGVPIAASTVSTGRPGYSTPTGVFTILQKRVEHYSSTYDNAPMPYMQRLTWRGVALHAGNLPGYPASHGCIRLPLGFAKLLYGATRVGMTVVITDAAATPRVAPTPDIAVAGNGAAQATPGFDWHPERSPTGPVSILVSAADNRAVVLRNGVEIGSAPVTVQGPVRGTWAYALKSVDRGRQEWLRIDLDGAASQPVPREEWQRFGAAPDFRRAVAAILEPGATIVVTRDSLRPGEAVTVIEDEESANAPSR